MGALVIITLAFPSTMTNHLSTFSWQTINCSYMYIYSGTTAYATMWASPTLTWHDQPSPLLWLLFILSFWREHQVPHCPKSCLRSAVQRTHSWLPYSTYLYLDMNTAGRSASVRSTKRQEAADFLPNCEIRLRCTLYAAASVGLAISILHLALLVVDPMLCCNVMNCVAMHVLQCD